MQHLLDEEARSSSQPRVWGDDMSSNGELVNQAYAAFARQDIASIIELLDDGVEWSSPKTLPHGGDFRGKDGVLEFFMNIGNAWESLAVEAESVDELPEGRVVAVASASGSLSSGTHAGYGAAHLFDLRDGKIMRFRELVDVDRAITG
jgi:ketosteroid isomerase-like protein